MSTPKRRNPAPKKPKTPDYNIGPHPDDIFNFPYQPPKPQQARHITPEERFEHLITNPQLHQIAREVLPTPPAGSVGRPTDYPRWVYFVFLCAISVFGSARSTAAHFARPRWWSMVKDAIRDLYGDEEADQLGDLGPTRGHWNYAFRRYLKTNLAAARDLSSDAWIQQAVDTGLLAATRGSGTWLRPERDEVLHGDATVAAPPSLHTHATSVDKKTGEIRHHRIDPDATTQTEGGGRRVYGNKLLALAIRAAWPHSRIILVVDSVRSKKRRHDPERLDEGAALVHHTTAIKAKVPALRFLTYDTAVRGVHRAPLIAQGIVVYSPQHSGPEPHPLMEYTPGETSTRRHPCRHTLYAAGGRICERKITVDGKTLYEPLPVLELQPRIGRTSRFYHLATIPCRNGEHTVRIRVDETSEDREIDPSTKRARFNRAEHLKQIPPGTNAGKRLKGFRQDSESLHSRLDQTYPHKAMPAYGAVGALLIYIGFAWVNNSIARAVALSRRAA